MPRSRRAEPNRLIKLKVATALLGVAALLGVVVVVHWVVGESTSAFLEAAGRLEGRSFYSGLDKDHLIGTGAYWALALAYAAPVLLCAVFVPVFGRPQRLVDRRTTYALLGFTALYTLAVVLFAFDPSRTGLHEPLNQRYEELSYEAADLVLAAAWTMLVTLIVGFSTITAQRRTLRVAVTAVTFAGAAAVFAAVFT